MKKEFILMLDSGVGGISILKECVKKLPQEHFLYVADNKNAPYGNKSQKTLNKLAHTLIINFIQRYSIKLIVIACNTLTASSIAYLRSQLNVPIVGVEPAIKPALEEQKKDILVLTTKATLKYNAKLKSYKNQKGNYIYFLTFSHLAKKIDELLDDLNELQPYINQLFKKIKKKEINGVVLGCTHYSFIQSQIQTAFSKPLTFYESSVPVACRVESVLKEQNKLSNGKKGTVTIVCTRENQKLHQQLMQYLKK